jgi:hypothetical protein
MAFGATITVTVNAVAKVLNRINQDNYGSEYYLRLLTDEYRMKIRHSKESPQSDGRVFDRHNVELTHTIFAVGATAEVKRIVSSTFRILSTDDLTQAGYLTGGFIDYVDGGTVQADLLTWQS